MNQIEELKEIIRPVLEKMNLELFDLQWLKGKDKTLQISITNLENKIDLDNCVMASEAISEELDRLDPIKEEYTLEVCSPGAEREITDLNQLTHLIGSYVLIQLKEPYKAMNEIKGEIKESTDNSILIEYRDKAATRKADIHMDNISFARFAVKI